MKTPKSDFRRLAGMITLCGAILSTATSLCASSIFTISNTTADAFLASGPTGGPNLSGLNFGNAGTLAVAPAGSPKGEFDSVIKFNTAAAVSQFNATYGIGNWQITGFTLSLASSFGTQGAQPGNTNFNTINGGSFGIDWLGNDSWAEGTGGGNGAPAGASISFNSLSTLFSAGSASLGSFTYTPPGNGIYENYLLPLNSSLVSDAAAGGDVSLYFFAADNQVSYLFNSREFTGTPSGHPELALTATAIPEPTIDSLAASALTGLLISRRLKLRS
jgi:hypothetical protein